MSEHPAPSHALARFEPLPRDFVAGTCKLYSRADFLPFRDPRANCEGDFIGRFRALFGPSEGDEYVLWHRASGFVITAYCGQSGPAYGGAPRYDSGRPVEPRSESTLLAEWNVTSEAGSARAAADPVLAKGPPEGWPPSPGEGATAIWEQMRLYTRHLHDVEAPPGFAAVVAELDALLEAVEPVDWEAIRCFDDFVCRAGASGGRGFSEELPFEEGVPYMLDEAERATGELAWLPQARAIKYFLDGCDERHDGELDEDELSLDGSDEDQRDTLSATIRPRVEAAWFRLVQLAHGETTDRLRASTLEEARDLAERLGVDPLRREQAMNGGVIRDGL
jgi:hypothetical protein